MPPALCRLASLLKISPEPTEIATGLIAIGWAWNVMHVGAFGPPGTTVRHVADEMGPWLAGFISLLAAFLPIASIALGNLSVRFASTCVCGLTWTSILIVSFKHGTWMSLLVWVSVICLTSLFWSQCSIIHRFMARREL